LWVRQRAVRLRQLIRIKPMWRQQWEPSLNKESSMRSTFILVATAAALAISTGALAQSEKDHAAHHPAAPASAPKATKSSKPKAPAAASAPTSAQMVAQMQSMHDMHDRMMAAKSPEERQAMMDNHMRTMQDGMAMMGRIQSGPGGASGMSTQQEMMMKRMDMMQMMMQMMMDRDVAPAAK